MKSSLVATTLVLAALLHTGAGAQQLDPLAPEVYYQTIDTSATGGLRAALHALIRGHQRISYDSGANWPILESADENPGNSAEVLDFYRNDLYDKVTDRTTGFNREHMWPQSFGFSQALDTPGSQGFYPRCDLHSLFLADAGYNSARGNSYYAFVSAPRSARETVFNNGVGGGAVVYPGNHNWDATGSIDAWEVWNGRRGESARALLYMDLRYEGGTHPVTGDPEPDLVLTNNIALITPTTSSPAYMGLLSDILQWHSEDDVDAMELRRMGVIAQSQQNRNPFVDYPELVPCLHGGDCTDVPPINPGNVIALPRDGAVRLQWNPRPESDLVGYDVYTGPTASGPWTRRTVSTISSTSTVISGLTNGVEVYLVVRALDTDGNESRNSAAVRAVPGTREELFAESFENPPGATYTLTGGAASLANDYYGRFTSVTRPSGMTAAFDEIDQVTFIAMEDTDGNVALPVDAIHTIATSAIPVAGYSDLRASLAVGGLDGLFYDLASGANGDYLKVFASVDGGPDTLVGQLTKLNTGASNGALAVDTNLDGIGDVTLASFTALNRIEFPIAATGNALTIKLTTKFNSDGEEFVMDDLRLSGEAPVSSITGWMLLD